MKPVPKTTKNSQLEMMCINEQQEDKPKLVRKHDLKYQMLKKNDLADILTKDNSLSKEDFPSISEEINNIVSQLD